jgi:hypothetical protein
MKNGQSRDTDNICAQDTGRRQTKQKHNIENWKKKMSNTDPTKTRGWTQVLAKGMQFQGFLWNDLT